MCLAIYAYKCGVPKKQLRQDMQQAFEDLQKVKHENVLTEDDIRSALEAYDKEYYNFMISDIEALTDVRIEKNKRNGRKQEQHIKIMNAIRDIEHPNGAWRNISGRPSVREQVFRWREQHPESRKADCHRDTGLDPKTIRKWWDYQPPATNFEDGHISVKIRPSQKLSDMLVEAFKDRL